MRIPESIGASLVSVKQIICLYYTQIFIEAYLSLYQWLKETTCPGACPAGGHGLAM
jgi:hypothetical protein